MPHRAARERLSDILNAIERIRSYTDGLTYEQFCTDRRTAEAVQLNFIIIGEAAGHVPDELVQAHPGIPWREMRGLRNVITHGYFSVSLLVVWQTATNDLPPLLRRVRELLDQVNSG